jgi:hypothetical protein
MKLEKIYSNLRKQKLKDSTITTNIRNLKRITTNIFNKTIEEFTIKELQDYQKIFEYVDNDELCCASMKNKILNTVINISKCFKFPEEIFEIYKNKFNELSKKYLNDRQLGKPYQKELDNLITFDEIKKIRDSYKPKLTEEYKPKIDIPYLLLCLYTYMPPLRCQDWYSSKVFNGKSEFENYLNLKNRILTITNYKTMKRYGKREIELPIRLINIIKKFHKKSGSEWLLPERDINKHITDANCTHLLQKILNKKVSCHMLRKIYISDKINENTPIVKMKELAKIMAHSLSSQQLTYQRFTGKVINQ